MRNKERLIAGFDFFVIRTPRLPLETLRALNERFDVPSLDGRLLELFRDPELRDAIFLASESLASQLEGWIAGKSTLEPKAQSALYKYGLRMSGRCTPFGKFSGIASGEKSSRTSLLIEGAPVSTMRFDMGFTAHLVKLAYQDTALSETLHYRCNDTLYALPDHYRYIEYRDVESKRSYRWVKVARNPVLQSLIEYTRSERRFAELTAFLAAHDIPSDLAIPYLEQLVGAQVLIGSLAPAVTGKHHFQLLLEHVTALAPERDFAGKLTALDRLGRTGGSVQEVVQATRQLLGPSLHGWSGPSIVQVDARVSAKGITLSDGVLRTILREVEELLPLNRATPPTLLDVFKQRFLERYAEQEVPLMQALDPDRGVGYGNRADRYLDRSPLLKNLPSLHAGVGTAKRTSPQQNLIRQLWSSSVPSSGITITEQDLDRLSTGKEKPYQLPLTAYLHGNLIAAGAKHLDNGDFSFNLLTCSGPSAIPLMARFCYLDPGLERQLRQCADMEQRACPDVIFAEVVHLPGDRIGNILQRPALRQYEIPLLGSCSVEPEYQIPLSDLLVSVRSGSVLLRSRRLGKIVIPTLSNAHNYRSGIAVYQFLCDLQYQANGLDLSWDWGELSALPALPRVTYKHLILSRAQWNVPRASLDESTGGKDILLQIQERYGLPMEIVLADGDNELTLDLRNPVARRVLHERLRKGGVRLYENLFSPGASPVADTDGNTYANEVIIPFACRTTYTPPVVRTDTASAAVRSFPPGSEWLYCKLYCSEGDADQLLYRHIAPLTSEFFQANWIDKWFFVRYHDPEPHLRLRFLIPDADRSSLLMKCIEQHIGPLVADGVVQRIVYDTYVRELERYGHAAIEWCESVFHADSQCLMQLLPVFSDAKGGEQQRWLTAMLGVDDLFSAFRVTTIDRLHWIENWKEAFHAEFGVDKRMRRALDARFRQYSTLIDACFRGDSLNSTLSNVLERRTKTLSQVAGNARWDAETVKHILPSLCHMYLNRVFFADQRAHEMVMYHFLAKYYLSVSRRASRYQTA
jgi:thiopeptide-type bacteriocin biosynthesis domain